MRTFTKNISLTHLLSFLFLFLAPDALAVTTYAAASDAEDGYVQRALQKIMQKWSPPSLRGNYSVQVKVSLDGEGRVLSCTPLKKSSMEVFDKVVCAAVKDSGPFGRTSYEAPMDFYLSFYMGDKEQRAGNHPSDLDALRAEVSARAKAEREQAEKLADNVERRAREKAEHAARSQGRELPQVSPAPIAEHPKNVRERQAREKSEKKDAQKPEAQEKSKNPAPRVKQEEKALLPNYGEKVDGSIAHQPRTAQTPRPAPSTPKPDLDGKASREQRYVALLERYLNRVVILPDTLPPGQYDMVAKVEVSREGRITSVGVVKSSGEKKVDQAMLRCVRQSKTVPAPPKSLGHEFRVPLRATK